jgi:hypothetical protein
MAHGKETNVGNWAWLSPEVTGSAGVPAEGPASHQAVYHNLCSIRQQYPGFGIVFGAPESHATFNLASVITTVDVRGPCCSHVQ